MRAAGGTLSSHARVKVLSGDRTTSFSARMSSDFGERLRINVYSPLGTEIATLDAAGSTATVLDHVNRRVWKGRWSELPAGSPLGPILGGVTPDVVANVLFALPTGDRIAGCNAGPGNLCASDGALVYILTRDGLLSARGESINVAYEPVAFPPRQVSITAGTTAVTVTHNEVVLEKKGIAPLTVPAGYAPSDRPWSN
jgi:hypothetical protein